MSREIETEVWRHCRAKGVTKMVMVCIGNEAANVNRIATIDPLDIAEQCNLKPRWIKYQIDILEEMHEIEKLGTNTYRVRRYLGTGPLAGMEVSLQEHPPRSDIKKPERQHALQAKRPRARRRK